MNSPIHHRLLFILLVGALWPLDVHAQAFIGNCDTGTADAYLDVGNVRARILNNGALFWADGPSVYEVPKGEGVDAIFYAILWVGGKVGDKLVTSGAMYRNWEFWPGPLDEAGLPPDDCTTHDRLWEIRKEDIDSYLSTGIISENLREWPWHLGAPVRHWDGDPATYDVEAGDLPELLGDQRIWWIMNDRGNTHKGMGSDPMGIEVQGSAFAFTSPELSKHTFYHYKIINKRAEPITDIYVGGYFDVDLGNFSDDYVGTDTTLGLGYVYNADNFDDDAYEEAPPAIGFTFLQTPDAPVHDGLDNNRDGVIDEAGEDLDAVASVHFFGDGGQTGDPQNGSDMYNYLKGYWAYGDPITEGGVGFMGGGKQIRFHYPGDPTIPTFWSELNTDGDGTRNEDNDQRITLSTGPFDLMPNEAEEVTFAIVWARGTDHLDSVRELKKEAQSIRENGLMIVHPVHTKQPDNHQLISSLEPSFPNPFSRSTALRYRLAQSGQVRLSVINVIGQEVALLVDGIKPAGKHQVEFNAGHLPAGVYLARLQLDGQQLVRKLVLRP